MRDMVGKTILITGGSSGIGRGTATVFAKRGANCVLTHFDATNDAGERVAASVRELGGQAIAFKSDARSEADTVRAIETAVSTFGGLDYAFNNGAKPVFGEIADMTEEIWDESVNGLMKSVWLGMKHEILQMRKQGRGGVIVNTSSTCATIFHKTFGAYAACKAGVISLTKTAAFENGPDIRINAVSPGPIMTEGKGASVAKFPPDFHARQAEMYKYMPQPRQGDPTEVGEAVAWLCSDAASFVTGANIVVDGGQSIR